MITPAAFEMRYAWQFQPWFAAKERRVAALEVARRTRKPGQPLREPLLDPADAAYAAQWESGDEGGAMPEGTEAGDDEAAEAAAAASAASTATAAADEDAAADPTGRTGAALAAARAAARARRQAFLAPAYDADGRPLEDTAAQVERMAAGGLTVSVMHTWEMGGGGAGGR
jgi:hypothetical protein